jgi:ABC-type amino acid transport substrate-binding protein
MEMVFAVCRKARRPGGILCKPEITDLPRHRMNAHRARKPLFHGFAAVAWALAAACGASAAAAQTVLERVSAGGALVIAHRESSVPFSYVDEKTGKPVGYAVDLCLHLAEVVRRKTGMKDMAVRSCRSPRPIGSISWRRARRTWSAAPPPTMPSGARRWLSPFRTSSRAHACWSRRPAQSTRVEDLMGKKMVSTKGTTPLKAVQQANRERLMGITIVEAPDHARALEMVEKGEADAFLMDDVLLFGLAANRPDPKALKVVGRFVTTEPLAIMLPKGDPDFKKMVDDEMRRLITSREIHAIYDKWFAQPIPPNNTALNLPVSYLLRDFWKYPTDQVPF